MSATGQAQGLPWSRGRGFRPKGPFQPARRPGNGGNGPGNGGNGSPAESNHVDSSPGNNSKQSYNKPSYNSNSNQGGNRPQSNRNPENNSYQNKNSLSNGYQGRSNPSNSYQGNNSTRDIRFAGNNQQPGSRGPSSQVQYKQNGTESGVNKGSNGSKDEKRVLAKYNYKANPASPLGEPELSLTQGQKVSLVGKHASNDQWWKVKADDGSEGYVPATYVMILESKPSALPWLANQKQDQEVLPEAKPVFKPYKSAYDKPAQSKEEPEEKKPNLDYYCEICEKQLNGPKPYGAHMASKAHREEVEFAKETGKL